MQYRLRRLDNRDRKAILKLLLTELYANLFLLDILMKRGISNFGHEEWYGSFYEQELLGIAVTFGRTNRGMAARLVVSCGEPSACIPLGQVVEDRGGTELIIGERAACDGLYEKMDKSKVHIHYDQRLYVCKKENLSHPTMPIRFAKNKDFGRILEYSALMMAEDLQIDPLQLYPDRFRKSIQSKIDRFKSIVAEKDGEICYTIDIGTQFGMGCQLGGTYVPPSFRGQGISKKATAAVCELLLQSCDCVTLHVHEKNIPAIRCYESVGFHADAPFRLIAFQGKQHAQQKKKS